MNTNSISHRFVLPVAAALWLLTAPSITRAAAISCGQTVAGATTSPSENDAYAFAGSAGQQVSIALWGPTDCANGGESMVADIYNPSGQLVASVAAGCSGSALNLILTNSGTFTMLVHDSVYGRTGSYQLSLQSTADGGCNGETISCGQSVRTNTVYNSEMDAYGYIGNAGQEVSLALWGPTRCSNGGESMVADIYDPQGQLLATVAAGCSGSALNLILTNTGTFTILVHDSIYGLTGSYELSLQSVIGGGCNGQKISCGETLGASTVFRSEMDAYSYTGNAGQEMSVALWGPTYCANGGESMVADIYNPEGQLVTTVAAGCSGSAQNVTLTNNGTFTVLVHDSIYGRTGGYQLSVQSVIDGGCSSLALPCGGTVTGQITTASQMNALNLAANAGEHVIISSSGFSGMMADVYDPQGANIASIGPSSSTNLVLQAPGVYTILVHANNYASTGNYSVSLTVFGGCASLNPQFTVGQTQQEVCLPLQIADSAPPSLVSFDLEVSSGVLTNPTVAVAPPFTNATVTQLSGLEWVVTMGATNGGSPDQVIGSICFTANAAKSQFVNVALSNLVISNQDGSIPGTTPLSGQAVIIAGQSLLQAQVSTNGQRSITLYGKANTDYVVESATNLNGGWTPGWTNTVPGSMWLTSPVEGASSNAPVLFLRAREQ